MIQRTSVQRESERGERKKKRGKETKGLSLSLSFASVAPENAQLCCAELNTKTTVSRVLSVEASRLFCRCCCSKALPDSRRRRIFLTDSANS